jgi:hypothetical protein
MKMSILDRILLLLTGLLAAYQVAIGIEGFATLPIIAYSIAFGALLVAGLLLIILGFDVLDEPIVVIISTIIPLSLSIGLVWQYFPTISNAYLIWTVAGFLLIILTRAFRMPNKIPMIVLAVVHGVAGLTIFLLPIWLVLQGEMGPIFSLVGFGSALMGVGGLLLFFMKGGRPILAKETILKTLPGLLLLMTISLVAGFKFG